MGREVVAACLNVLNSKGDLSGWNAMTITLIQKCPFQWIRKTFDLSVYVIRAIKL